MTYIQTLLAYAKQFVAQCRSGINGMEEVQYQLTLNADEINTKILETQERVAELLLQDHTPIVDDVAYTAQGENNAGMANEEAVVSYLEQDDATAMVPKTQWAIHPEDSTAETPFLGDNTD